MSTLGDPGGLAADPLARADSSFECGKCKKKHASSWSWCAKDGKCHPGVFF